MLIKIKHRKTTKVCRGRGTIAEVMTAVRLALGVEDVSRYRLLYQDCDGETIDVMNQEDLDACLEEYRLIQKVTDSNDVKITLVVVGHEDDFEVVSMENKLSHVSGFTDQFLDNRSIEDLDQSSIPLVKHESENLDTPEINDKFLIDIPIETNDAVQNISCNCKATARELFQTMLVELLTEKDQSKLNSSFPLLFEPENEQSASRDAVSGLLNLINKSIETKTSSPQPSLETKDPLSSYNQWRLIENSPSHVHDVFSHSHRSSMPGMHRPLPIISQHQNAHQESNSDFFTRLASHINNVSKDIKGVFNSKSTSSNCQPGCQHCLWKKKQQEAIQDMTRAAQNTQVNAEAERSNTFDILVNNEQSQTPVQTSSANRDRTPSFDEILNSESRMADSCAPSDYTIEQKYFLVKLRKYLETDEVNAGALFWIKFNWNRVVGNRNIMECYPDVIDAMEQEKVISTILQGCTVKNTKSDSFSILESDSDATN